MKIGLDITWNLMYKKDVLKSRIIKKMTANNATKMRKK